MALEKNGSGYTDYFNKFSKSENERFKITYSFVNKAVKALIYDILMNVPHQSDPQKKRVKPITFCVILRKCRIA